MSKKTFKRIIDLKRRQLHQWAVENGIYFKTTAEIEREKNMREITRGNNNKRRGQKNSR